jgi:hypothetical protein
MKMECFIKRLKDPLTVYNYNYQIVNDFHIYSIQNNNMIKIETKYKSNVSLNGIIVNMNYNKDILYVSTIKRKRSKLNIFKISRMTYFKDIIKKDMNSDNNNIKRIKFINDNKIISQSNLSQDDYKFNLNNIYILNSHYTDFNIINLDIDGVSHTFHTNMNEKNKIIGLIVTDNTNDYLVPIKLFTDINDNLNIIKMINVIKSYKSYITKIINIFIILSIYTFIYYN